MSYICSYSNEVVSNQTRHLIPTELRKVKYNYYFLNENKYTGERNDEYLFSSDGYEISKEVVVCDANYEKFINENKPIFKGEKTLKIYIEKPKIKENTIADIETDDFKG